jgi:two-component system phosphate regulon sensor histidine kinase PhoR
VAFETVRVAALVDAAVLVCRPRALQKEVELSVTCPEDIEIMGNAGLLEQAVVNLLDNATKYSEPGRKVEVSCDREGAMIAIRVSDCGCGIAPEHLPRIFERFYRVDRARSRKLGGTGLGLAIVKHIMALHSGTVTVESTLGKGSCFTLHIPAYSVLPSFIG